MRLEDYEEDAGKKVWLSESEVEQLLRTDALENRLRSVAVRLGVRAGLRSAEVVDVAPQDVARHDGGSWLRVDSAKSGRHRETPLPEALATTLRTIGDVRDAPVDEPVVDVTTRTIQRWVRAAGDELAEREDDPGFGYLSPHDLRGTWATLLAGEPGVDAQHVLEWGGWVDLETFQEYYRGALSPDSQRRARESVGWL
jgi:integrase